MKIKEYESKPVRIKAIQFTEKLALDLFTGKEKPIFGKFSPSGSYHEGLKKVYNAYFYIDVDDFSNATMVCLNDYIIKHGKSKFSSCSPDEFKKKYRQIKLT
jgi:hypothetical protein